MSDERTRFAISEITPEAHWNDDRLHVLERVLPQLDRHVAETEGEGFNGLVVVAVRGDSREVYEKIIEALTR